MGHQRAAARQCPIGYGGSRARSLCHLSPVSGCASSGRDPSIVDRGRWLRPEGAWPHAQGHRSWRRTCWRACVCVATSRARGCACLWDVKRNRWECGGRRMSVSQGRPQVKPQRTNAEMEMGSQGPVLHFLLSAAVQERLRKRRGRGKGTLGEATFRRPSTHTRHRCLVGFDVVRLAIGTRRLGRFVSHTSDISLFTIA